MRAHSTRAQIFKHFCNEQKLKTCLTNHNKLYFIKEIENKRAGYVKIYSTWGLIRTLYVVESLNKMQDQPAFFCILVFLEDGFNKVPFSPWCEANKAPSFNSPPGRNSVQTSIIYYYYKSPHANLHLPEVHSG